MIPLIDIQNKKVIPSVHCYNIPWLKRIMDTFPDTYQAVYSYIFYTTCPDSTLNPYINVEEDSREDVVISDIFNEYKVDVDIEDALIQDTIARCLKMYETPALRAFKGAKKMLDKIGTYLQTESIIDGKEGNATTIKTFMSEMPKYWDTYSKMETILKEEQSKVRGGSKLRYDQSPGYTDSKRDKDEEEGEDDEKKEEKV